MNDDSERDERDEAIVSARIEGVSTRALAKRFACTGREIEAAIDRRLDYELDQRQRLRLVKLSVGRIEALLALFFERAVRDKDVPSGTLCCKLEERLSLLLGLDHPTTQRIDVYQVEQQQGPTDHELIRATIMKVVNSGTPAQKALRKRLDELSPEKALALLGGEIEGNGSAPEGNGSSGPLEPTR